MKYLLDTNICVSLMDDEESGVTHHYRRAVREGRSIAISTVVLFELQYGVHKSAYVEANRMRLETFLRRKLDVLPLSAEDVSQAGSIRANLERTKQPIGPYDTLIAGQAVARKLTLVTANVREFSRVAGLKWVNWSE